MEYVVTTFYRFQPVENPTELKTQIRTALIEREMVGLVILANEGLNATVAGSALSVQSFREWIQPILGAQVSFKDSTAREMPFKKVSVIVRPEIVTIKDDRFALEGESDGHLDAEAWHAMMTSGEDALLIDTRNRYETKIGMFKGAVDPEIDTFSEWPEYAASLKADRKKPVMIYCTGGIRCEKAALALESAGFEKVYQLRDGILAYLAKFPRGEFDGECFVFDGRVALTQDLQPSERFLLCKVCGDPTEDRLSIDGKEVPACNGCHPAFRSRIQKP